MYLRGGSLLSNINANNFIANDIDSYVIAILKLLYENDKNKVLTDLKKIIKEFDLRFDESQAKKQIVKSNYEKLKSNFNQQKNKFDYDSLIKLFVLVIFGFNSQIRFNKNNEFNIPAGKQLLNSNREKILLNFVDQIQSRNIVFQNKDFKFIYELLKDSKIKIMIFSILILLISLLMLLIICNEIKMMKMIY
ncbi:hypothetical protein MHSN_00240 [Metamycoplasma hyosynoviae]|uniref:site-specific DNA-methyltransferase (adenine-specific) n=1 Tax=Metamycoplasma hyosynoviae TaxID=29559 RepID=A0A4P1QFQ5_9BACT|nr:DNA adenine methylase [Metamycoplasma hyosynoviae]ASI53655.1 hypothetical protein MHSN_00240 [Metamycoplasma hyosynoviae]